MLGTVAAGSAGFNASAAATDTAGYATPGDVYLNAYGETVVATNSTAGSKVGFLFRYVDTSNYYAAYMTSTGAAVDSVVAGATTNILTLTFPVGSFSTLPTFRAEILDDTVTIWYRGDLAGTVKDSSLAVPGLVCLLVRGQGTAAQGAAVQFETGPYGGSYAPPLNQQAGPTRRHTRLR